MKDFGIYSLIISILTILFVVLKHIRDNKKGLHEQLYQQKILAYKQITKVSFELYYFVFKTFNADDFDSLLDADREDKIHKSDVLLLEYADKIQFAFFENAILINKDIRENIQKSLTISFEIRNMLKTKGVDEMRLNSLLDKLFQSSINELIELCKREIGFQLLSDDTVNRIVEPLHPFQIFKTEYNMTRMK